MGVRAFLPKSVAGVDFQTGALGHGLSIGIGMAKYYKTNHIDKWVVVMVGDGELNEGSIWEGAMFAAHHRLDNLVVIVDRNELCILGKTEELLSLGNLEAKWRSFGWETRSVNGHSFEELLDAF